MNDITYGELTECWKIHPKDDEDCKECEHKNKCNYLRISAERQEE